jgi:large subunit ribosomal protein L9
MEVLLLKDVSELGQAGDVKRVADGYARNYLIPRGLAVTATPGAIKQAEKQRQAAAVRQAKEVSQAQALAQALDGLTVTNVNIAEALKEQAGQEVDRRKIDLEEPLKELGTHAVTIRLAPEAEAKVTVVIEREE